MINYISTRGGGEPLSFEDVLLAGLAPDGGLYVPQTWPQIDVGTLKGKSYTEIAFTVMYPFVEGTIEADDFKSILEATYHPDIFRHDDVLPIYSLGNNIHVMEQFHGPTFAFKDIALQLLGRLFDHVLKKKNERITIVGATSGDTGSAAIEGCIACDQIDIFILHPKGRVSDVQRKQMTTIKAPNVFNIALDGTFDDCQNMVKAMFNDEEFRNNVNLSAVNSINWARIMAQIVYYFATALKYDEEASFVVPTGNFGNVFAAYCAQKMGLQIRTLCVSSNKNDILTRFFETGEMTIDQIYKTLSPSMDIQISSNFERYLFDLLDRDSGRLSALMNNFKEHGDMGVSATHLEQARAMFHANRADDDEILALIKDTYEQNDYILDPHTAVGMKGAKEIAVADSAAPVILLATAHPAKFPDAVEQAIGVRPELPEHLSDLFQCEEHMTEQPNDRTIVQNFVLEHSRVSS